MTPPPSRRRAFALVAIASLALLTLAARQQRRAEPIRGFTAASAARERALEAELSRRLSRDSTGAFFRYLTAQPHPAGSVRNKALADFMAERFRQYGLEDIRVHRYDVLLPWPREVKVEMTAPTRFVAALKEDAFPQDPQTSQDPGTTYLGMSGSGDVTGELVYASSGNPSDYDWLESQGISLKGKIAIVRYSVPYSYRGFKALTAQERGLAALLVYSDPAQDGFVKGDTFPVGPWGPSSHIQRGAITYDFMIAGDPLTPGYASLPGAPRIKPEDALSVPKIISVPMSYRDAEPLLRALGGPEAPKQWQGALGFTYHVGGGPATVHVKVDMDDATRPIYVVEGRIRGTEQPDKYVLLGNHRDAWVFGAVDPSSGTATQLELARVLGAMAKEGKPPRRSIVFASWDAEEWHLTGSTEWGENFADDVKENAIAYLNVDASTSGSNFQAGAVASLNRVVTETIRDVKDPTKPGSVLQAWTKGEHVANALGSGSDYTVFLNFLGVPVVEMDFDGPYGVYHSVYDDYYWMTHFGDPGFKYMTAMSEVWGRMAMRLANADVYPYDFAAYAHGVGGFIDSLAAQPSVAGQLDVSSARMATGRWSSAAAALDTALTTALAAPPGAARTARLRAANEAMRSVEQRFLSDSGIPGRPWFKHVLYAPKYTYAAMALPGVEEAVDQRDWPRARAQLAIVTAKLEAAALATRAAADAALGCSSCGSPRADADVRVPAFVDHHVHVFNVGWYLLQSRRKAAGHVVAGGAKSEAEVIARAADAAAMVKSAPGGWVTGFGWNQEAWGTSALPTSDALSAALPDIPVALARSDGHALWVNRAALGRAGLAAGAGAPGVLLERSAEPVLALVPAPSDPDVVAAWRLGAEALADRGVGRAYDAGVLALPGIAALNTDFARYARLLAESDRAQPLPLELFLMIPAPSPYAEQVLAMPRAERQLSPRVRITHLKLFADGALGSRGAALSHPYADDPRTSGVLRMRAPEIAEWTRRGLDAGLDVATHAIGDRAVREVLDAYETVLRARPDVKPTFAEQRVGSAGAARVYAWNRLARMGAVLVEGSDSFGAPGPPLLGLYSGLVGVNAIGERGDSPEVRRELLRLNATWLAPGGTLQPPGSDTAGARFVMLSADPLRVPVESLLAVRVRSAQRP